MQRIFDEIRKAVEEVEKAPRDGAFYNNGWENACEALKSKINETEERLKEGLCYKCKHKYKPASSPPCKKCRHLYDSLADHFEPEGE